MTDLSRKRGLRAVLAAGFALAAALTLAPPVAAQGDEVSSCIVNDESTIELGRFDTVGAAIRAARARKVAPGEYAVATVPGGDGDQRTVAIDSNGGVHKLSDGICVGSGQRLRPPD